MQRGEVGALWVGLGGWLRVALVPEQEPGVQGGRGLARRSRGSCDRRSQDFSKERPESGVLRKLRRICSAPWSHPLIGG